MPFGSLPNVRIVGRERKKRTKHGFQGHVREMKTGRLGIGPTRVLPNSFKKILPPKKKGEKENGLPIT